MAQVESVHRVYYNALKQFKSQAVVYLTYAVAEITQQFSLSQNCYEINFHILNLDINADNNLGFGALLEQMIPHAQYIDKEAERILVNETSDVLILDQPNSFAFFEELFSTLDIARRSVNILIISTLFPQKLQGLIFKALQRLYEQFSYFPRLSFSQKTLECSFSFYDTVKQVLGLTAVSADFVRYSLDIPLFRAYFYPNNVRTTLLSSLKELSRLPESAAISKKSRKTQSMRRFSLPPSSPSYTDFLSFCTLLKDVAYFDFGRLLVALETMEPVNVQECFTQVKGLDAQSKAGFARIYGENASNLEIAQMLAVIRAKYSPSPQGLSFCDFGYTNFKGRIIDRLCNYGTTRVGIVFRLLYCCSGEEPYDAVFRKFFASEGRRFSNAEECVREFEAIIGHLVEYGVTELKLSHGSAFIVRKF